MGAPAVSKRTKVVWTVDGQEFGSLDELKVHLVEGLLASVSNIGNIDTTAQVIVEQWPQLQPILTMTGKSRPQRRKALARATPAQVKAWAKEAHRAVEEAARIEVPQTAEA